MTIPVLLLEQVTKRFSGHLAVDRLSLAVPQGSIYGLLGPNGAGKTTAIRMVMNILLPDEGAITLFGRGARPELAHLLGYMPEERGLYRRMRVLELLVFLGESKGIRRRHARAQAEAWLSRLGLGDWADRKIDDLSKGMQQKVQFIGTVLHEPRLIVLDEPFAGLDPVNAQVLKDTVVELKRAGTTILFSTHIMEHAEKLCDHVCIIAKGRKLVDGSLAEVKRGHAGRHVIVSFDGPAGAAGNLFRDPSRVVRLDDYDGYAELELAAGADPQALLADLVRGGARLRRFEITEPTLHKVFVDLVGREAAEAVRQEGGGA